MPVEYESPEDSDMMNSQERYAAEVGSVISSPLRVACIHGRYEKHMYSDDPDIPKGGRILTEPCPGGREVTGIEGIVTATGNNTMPGHGEPGPWAYVTVYGDFEVFDTMLVTPLSEV